MLPRNRPPENGLSSVFLSAQNYKRVFHIHLSDGNIGTVVQKRDKIDCGYGATRNANKRRTASRTRLLILSDDKKEASTATQTPHPWSEQDRPPHLQGLDGGLQLSCPRLGPQDVLSAETPTLRTATGAQQRHAM